MMAQAEQADNDSIDTGPAAIASRSETDSDEINFTDSESRIIFTSSNRWQQTYNVQNSVDMNSYMILIGDLTQATNDKQ